MSDFEALFARCYKFCENKKKIQERQKSLLQTPLERKIIQIILKSTCKRRFFFLS